MNEQQRRQICAELARRMYPNAVIEPSLTGFGVDIRIYDKPNETRTWYNFAPLTSAEDKDEMVKWLADQSAEVWANFSGLLIDAAIPVEHQEYANWEMVTRAVMTSSLETITLAAARALDIPVDDPPGQA